MLIIFLITYVIFLLAAAYFAAVETAILSITTTEFANLAVRNKKLEKLRHLWESNSDEVIASILLGTNLAIIGLGIINGFLARHLNLLSGKNIFFWLWPILSILFILIGTEIIPKIYARYHYFSFLQYSGWLLLSFRNFLSQPATTLLSISRRLLTIFGQRKIPELPFSSRREISIFLRSPAIGVNPPTRWLLSNIVDFADRRVAQAMIPREKIKAVDINQPRQAITRELISLGYSRIPLYQGNLDNIVGIIYTKDLCYQWRNRDLIVLEDLIRPAYFVPATMRLEKLLAEFRCGHQHLALVVNEFGSIVGLITIEDLAEEIVGDIWDEHDVKEKLIQVPSGDNSYLVSGSESLTKLCQELDIDLIAGFATVNGWLLDLIGQIPPVGYKLHWKNLEIEIIDADRRKINLVKIRKI